MRKLLAIAALRTLTCVLLSTLVWAAGFAWFTAQVPTRPAADSVTTDAIVVLTGGKGRIAYGLKLLREGRASRLFISGVEDGVTLESLSIHEGSRAVVMLGYSARNTIGNAMETAQWMKREHLSSLRLVTTSYHMPRALYEFRFSMPEVTLVPDPVVPEDADATSRMVLREYHKFIAAVLRHWLLLLVGDAE